MSLAKIKETYLIVSKYPKTCKLDNNQKSMVYAYIKALNQFRKTPIRPSICQRYHAIELGRRILMKYGEL